MSNTQTRTFRSLLLILLVLFASNRVHGNSNLSLVSSTSGVKNEASVFNIINADPENRLIGAKEDVIKPSSNEDSGSDEKHPTSSPRTVSSTTSAANLLNPYRLTMGRLILMLFLGLSLPIGFLGLLFWKLRKEKKYASSRPGALVYTETVLVPSYTVSDANNANPHGTTNVSVNQIYSTLYDTPPEYDAVVKAPIALEKSEKSEPPVWPEVRVQVQNTTTSAAPEVEDVPPPPAYSTVYI